jgi:hypothetical protein
LAALGTVHSYWAQFYAYRVIVVLLYIAQLCSNFSSCCCEQLAVMQLSGRNQIVGANDIYRQYLLHWANTITHILIWLSFGHSRACMDEQAAIGVK